MTEGPLLIAETPNAGALGHRYLVPAGVAFSELVAIHYVDQSRGSETKRGDDFLAVSSEVRQVKTGRENMPQTLVLAGINVGQLDETTIEHLFGRLKEVLTRLDPMAQAADWPVQTSGLILQREEIAAWQRECFAEPLPPRPLWEAAREKHARDREPAAGGQAKWWAAAGLLLLIPLVILASRGWWQHPDPDPNPPPVTNGTGTPNKDGDAKPPPSTELWVDRVVAFRARTKSVAINDPVGPLLQQADELLQSQPAENLRDANTSLSSWKGRLKERRKELESIRDERQEANRKQLDERWTEFSRACVEEPAGQKQGLQKVADQLGSAGFWKFPAELEEEQEKARQQLLALTRKRASVLERLVDPKLSLAQLPGLIDLVRAYDKIPAGRPLVDRQTEKLRRLVAEEAGRLVTAACAGLYNDKASGWERLRLAEYEGVKAQLAGIEKQLPRADGWEELAVEKWHRQLDQQRAEAVAKTERALYEELRHALEEFQEQRANFDADKDLSVRLREHQRLCMDFNKLQGKVDAYLNPPEAAVGKDFRPAREKEVREKFRPAPVQDVKAPMLKPADGLTLGLTGFGMAEMLAVRAARLRVVPQSSSADKLQVTVRVVPASAPGKEGQPQQMHPQYEGKEFVQNIVLKPLDLVTLEVTEIWVVKPGKELKVTKQGTRLILQTEVTEIRVTKQGSELKVQTVGKGWLSEPLSAWRQP